MSFKLKKFTNTVSRCCGIQLTHFSSVSSSKPQVFSRRNKKLQRQVAALSPELSIYEYLKKEVASLICDRVADVKHNFPSVLDISSGRGFVSKELMAQEGVNYIVQGDMCEEYLQKRYKSELPCDSVVFDEEKLPYRDNIFDMVVSSMGLHWANDLPGCFSEIKRVLKDDGCFIGVMCGADTLFELRCSLQLAETERQGGISPHVSPMIQGHQLSNLLSSAGFNLVTLDFDQLVVHYPSMFELLEDLKGMGENNAIIHAQPLHRTTLLAAASVYQAMYSNSTERGVPATFQLLFMIGWKPHRSQQKPLKQGAVPKGFNVKSLKT